MNDGVDAETVVAWLISAEIDGYEFFSSVEQYIVYEEECQRLYHRQNPNAPNFDPELSSRQEVVFELTSLFSECKPN